MAWTTIGAIYFIVWWLVLFTMLPFGVRTASETGEEQGDGHAASAPVRPMLWRKAAATTVISAVLVGGVFWLEDAGIIDMRRFLFGPERQ